MSQWEAGPSPAPLQVTPGTPGVQVSGIPLTLPPGSALGAVVPACSRPGFEAAEPPACGARCS